MIGFLLAIFSFLLSLGGFACVAAFSLASTLLTAVLTLSSHLLTAICVNVPWFILSHLFSTATHTTMYVFELLVEDIPFELKYMYLDASDCISSFTREELVDAILGIGFMSLLSAFLYLCWRYEALRSAFDLDLSSSRVESAAKDLAADAGNAAVLQPRETEAAQSVSVSEVVVPQAPLHPAPRVTITPWTPTQAATPGSYEDNRRKYGPFAPQNGFVSRWAERQKHPEWYGMVDAKFLDEDVERAYGFTRMHDGHSYRWMYKPVSARNEHDEIEHHEPVAQPRESPPIKAPTPPPRKMIEVVTTGTEMVSVATLTSAAPTSPPQKMIEVVTTGTEKVPVAILTSAAPVEPALPPPPSSIRHGLDTIPSTPQPLLPPPTLEAAAPQPPQIQVVAAPARSAESLLSGMASRAEELRGALIAFSLALQCLRGYVGPAMDIMELLRDAHGALQVVFPDGLARDVADLTGWPVLLADFWQLVQPVGYVFVQHGNGDLLEILSGIYQFAAFLGMSLEAPNLTPPPPPPPSPPAPTPASVPEVVERPLISVSSAPDAPVPAQEVAPSAPQESLSAPGAPQPAGEVTVSAPRVAFTFSQPSATVPEMALKTPSLPRSASARSRDAKARASRPRAQAAQSSTQMQGPQPLPASSTPKPPMRLLDFTRPETWGTKSNEELSKLVPASFGWVGEEKVRFKVWCYSTMGELHLGEVTDDWEDPAWAAAKLNSFALKFKQAAIVLRLQSAAPVGVPDETINLSFVLDEVLRFIKAAADLTRNCEGLPEDRATWAPWWRACMFYDKYVIYDEAFRAGYLRHYAASDPEIIDAMESRWKRRGHLWLGQQEEA